MALAVTPSRPSVPPGPDAAAAGLAMHRLAAELFPICRSITGNGVRATLRLLQGHIPLTLHEVPSGTRVFDWTVPQEWNIVDAYVRNSAGERVIDFKKSNLHVVGYSVPVRTRLSLADLKPHLISLPERPDAIPYRTSFYKGTWGFCLSHRQLLALPEDEYEVCIDSSLTSGHLTYGECYLPGETEDEVLISAHVCHPSLGNDNLSGIAVATFLARQLQTAPRHLSYRFLFIPATIGSITWLALNEPRLARIKHGLVLANLGDRGHLTYKVSRRGDAAVDRAARNVLRHSGSAHEVRDFLPYGYDERQFCSPGIDLPVGCLSRTPHGEFPEYHTSGDDLDFLQPASLADSLASCLAIVRVLEGNHEYVNQSPKGEPQLGRRGLYEGYGGSRDARARELALLWVLNLSDGRHSLLDISDRSGIDFVAIRNAADALLAHGLLKQAVR
jgi:aminopeptidase-like protein